MLAHKLKLMVPENHELLVRLPEDFPAGETEVIFLSAVGSSSQRLDPRESLDAWLDRWVAELPPAPDLPLEAFDREQIYP